ncbi:MAG: polyphosphate kinase 1 [Elusimicrobiales bacterium]
MSDKYINRELSLLEFNRRVLAQAADETLPALERLKFCGITSSNMDEFFMVRVPRLDTADPESKTVRLRARELVAEQYALFSGGIIPALERAGICRADISGLDAAGLAHARGYFERELLPVLTPLALRRRMPHLANLRLYFIAGFAGGKYAAVEVPANLPRMAALPAQEGLKYLLLEDIVARFAQELFAGREILSRGFARLTRASELAFGEDAGEDFLKAMESAVRLRRKGKIARLEVSAPKDIRDFLGRALDLSSAEIVDCGQWPDIKGISQLAFQPGFENLKRKSWRPRRVSGIETAGDVWKLLRERDVTVHLPYESFDAFKVFLSEAARDPGVLAIKQTLYRVGADAPVAAILESAASAGKQVTVLVELMARFDEENNIGWARRLEAAGANVIYGVAGLKTHAKACLVVRREDDGIRRYVHLATGNYNDRTAKLYGDIGLFTAREDIAADISAFFNMVTGVSDPPAWKKIEAAPYGLRRKIIKLIEREAALSTPERPGQITAKMNSLADRDIIDALYAASRAGVKIRLNVRGICCLRPGVKDFSENIEVISVVDMFLEHSRILCLRNRGDEEVWLSSADWMPRNLDKRLELLFPVEDRQAKKEISDILSQYFRDNQSGWALQSDGGYKKLSPPEGKRKFRAQEYFCERAAEREAQQSRPVPGGLKPLKSPKEQA